ncbi:MAG: hypothetical protein AB8G22_26680 [Saprospiraceae bacterium]
MQLLFIFDSLWLNFILIFLLIWLLVSILVYKRNSPAIKGLYQWLILPAFMIFGEHKKSSTGAKSNAEIERFNAYLEESAVLQQLQTELKKRAGVDLQQIESLRAEVQRMSENYQHQSHYVTELSKKVSQQPSASVSYQESAETLLETTPVASDSHLISTEELETRLTEFQMVLKQIQKDTNHKLDSLRTVQDETQSQFEEEIDALSTAIGNISTAYDPRPALNDLNKKISTLELYVQEVQQELQQTKVVAENSNSSNPIQPATLFERSEIINPTDVAKKESFEGVKYNKEHNKSTPTEAKSEPTIELSTIDITADDHFKNYKGKMFFAAAPTNEIFPAEQLVSKFVAKVTPYAIKISTRDPQMAFYHLVTHAETVDYARLQQAEIIDAAMFVMGQGDLKNAERMTMKAGELELLDGKWEIVKRAVLRFE